MDPKIKLLICCFSPSALHLLILSFATLIWVKIVLMRCSALLKMPSCWTTTLPSSTWKSGCYSLHFQLHGILYCSTKRGWDFLFRPSQTRAYSFPMFQWHTGWWTGPHMHFGSSLEWRGCPAGKVVSRWNLPAELELRGWHPWWQRRWRKPGKEAAPQQP